ncbi:MAG: hypothetical protein FWC15_05185 [Fibromonadales bacterium]|nr:hypothetical protein [Fibromonadales bacterium]
MITNKIKVAANEAINALKGAWERPIGENRDEQLKNEFKAFLKMQEVVNILLGDFRNNKQKEKCLWEIKKWAEENTKEKREEL